MTSEQFLGQYIPTVGVAGVVAAIIIAGLKWANQSLATDLRDGVSLWILGEPGQASWSTVISRVFGSVYGRSYFSRRAVVSAVT